MRKTIKKMSTNEKVEKMLKEAEMRKHKVIMKKRNGKPSEAELRTLGRSRLYDVATSHRLAAHSPGKSTPTSPIRDGPKDFPARIWENKTVPIGSGISPVLMHTAKHGATVASRTPKLPNARPETCGKTGARVPNYMKATTSKRLGPPPPASTNSPDPTRFRPDHKMYPPRNTQMWGGQDPARRREDHLRRQKDESAKRPEQRRQQRPRTTSSGNRQQRSDGSKKEKAQRRPASADPKSRAQWPIESKHKLPSPSTQKLSPSATLMLRNFGDPVVVNRAATANKKRELFKWYCLKKLAEILRMITAEKKGFSRASISDHRSVPVPPGNDTSVADGFIEMLKMQNSAPSASSVDRDTFLGVLQLHFNDFSLGESLWVAFDRRNLGVVSLVPISALLHVAVVTDAADPIETLCSLFRIYCRSRPNGTLTLGELGHFRAIFSTAASTYDERVRMGNLVDMSFRWTMQSLLLVPEKAPASTPSPRIDNSNSDGADENSQQPSKQSAGFSEPAVALPFEDAEDLPINETHFRAAIKELPELPRAFHESLKARLARGGDMGVGGAGAAGS